MCFCFYIKNLNQLLHLHPTVTSKFFIFSLSFFLFCLKLCVQGGSSLLSAATTKARPQLCPFSFNMCACTCADTVRSDMSVRVITNPPNNFSSVRCGVAGHQGHSGGHVAPLTLRSVRPRHGGEMGLVAVIIISPFRAADPGEGGGRVAPLIARYQWGKRDMRLPIDGRTEPLATTCNEGLAIRSG